LTKLFISAFSCKNSGGVTDTVIKTISWEYDGNGYEQYSTNDSAEYGIKSYFTDSTYTQDPYSSATFYLIRKSGYDRAEYGGIFCYKDFNNYYRIVINNYGEYYISERFKSSSTSITTDWTFTSNLIAGYDKVNKIKVERDSNGKFTIYINDSNTYTFTNTDMAAGASGFYTHIDSEDKEQFPAKPNDTRFKITVP